MVRTSPPLALRLDLQAALMDEVESLDGIAPVDDARDINLVRALADHLDVHVTLTKRGEHAARDTDHVAHRLPDEREDRHVAAHGDLRSSTIQSLPNGLTHKDDAGSMTHENAPCRSF